MNKAYKFRIYPDEQQRILIEKTFGCCRKVYNMLLDDAKKQFEQTGKSKVKSYGYLIKEFEWLKEVDSVALAWSQMNLRAAYQKFFKKQNRFPRFHRKGENDSYKTQNYGSIRIVKNTIRLPKLGNVKCVFHRWVNGKIKSVTVSKSKSGKYFVSILVEQKPEVIEREIDNQNVIGIDMSMGCLTILSDGKKTNYPRYYRKYEKRLAILQRRLSRKKLDSQNREKQKVKVAKLHEKIANCRKDFQHNVSKQIIDKYDVIVVEGLNMQEMSQSVNLDFSIGKSVMDISYGSFRDMLKYKAEWNQKQIIIADKLFPSSKLCNICGYINDEVTIEIKNWVCPVCGIEHDKHLNAAINLKNYGTDAMSGSYACGDGGYEVDEAGKIDSMGIT